MKVHAGVDKDSGLIYSVVVTAANVHNPRCIYTHQFSLKNQLKVAEDKRKSHQKTA
jgi:hypothetical protein